MSDETILDDWLDAWEAARERGDVLDVEAICAGQPALRDEFLRRVDALDRMDQHLQGKATSAHDTPQLAYGTTIQQLKFHAKGGLGAVYVGQDGGLHRRVAVKFLHSNLTRDALSRQRFFLEAEVTGRLEHPGVIPMYGQGETDEGCPFYTMRFVDGRTLDAAIREYHQRVVSREATAFAGVDFRNLLAHFVSVCKTVAYAHNRGVVHRDIKPDNVMLGRYGETIVVDWGLAVTVDREERFRQSGEQTLRPRSGSDSGTSSGRGAGTPAYMSPEQASELIPTPASDIYSLGATLFKVLTGVAALSGDSLPEIRQRVIEGRIPRPLELRADMPPALDAICRKAMALRPPDRYATALDLARDIERFLADDAVEAYPETVSGRLSRFVRRHRAATLVAFLGLISICCMAAISAAWLGRAAYRESTARRAAEQLQARAEILRRENLSTSAQFLAKSIAQEIDLRWRILEAEAASPQLHQFLPVVNQALGERKVVEAAEREPLQRWMEKRYIVTDSAITSTCWALNAIEGTQVSRVPEANSIGQQFAHRDYFHARGRDLTPADIAGSPPIPLGDRPVYLSAVFQSSNTNMLIVAFSVPVWNAPVEDASRQRIGVLAMAVDLGDLSPGSRAILVDTREDQFQGRRGLVIYHPQLGSRSKSEQMAYLSDQDLDFALRLRQQRNHAERMRGDSRGNLVEHFQDPVDGRPYLAAVEPVWVQGRARDIADTGWVVVVLEQQP